MTPWYEIATESVRFATDRFQQNLETQKAVFGCKTPQDLLQLQLEYQRNAVEQYTSEATRIVEMISNSSAQSMGHVRRAYAHGYDDVPV